MTSHRTVKSYKKSSVPGVNIAQFVDKIPEGCSTPDFERKPVTLTLQEGKNAIFRAVVKGVPTPEVEWRRAKGEMDNPDKYEIFFNEVTKEYILKINKLTADDTDVYRCFAVNEYGEATCSAGLRIIQVGFKRKAQHVPAQSADELKKKLQDLRKLLRKRAPVPKQKTLDKEAIFQLLLHADKRDYEKICIKYGISDFRGMLRKLQEMRRDAESEQGELIHSIKNMEHIKINKDGTATFSLEMDLKNSNSKIYLLKDGERLRYGTGDEYRKHYLRRIGKKYNFIVNDVQPEDAGLYQVRVEDVPVFSTELDAESIPVRFQQPLCDVHCPEEGNAVFECILRSPCYDAVWLHKTHPLEASEKHQISVTPDGLTHQLVIKDVEASDNGMYTLDTGLCSSNAYLLVEYPKGKKRQDEGGEKEKSGWRKERLTDKAKKPKHGEHLSDKDHLMHAGMEKDNWYRNGQEGSQGYSTNVDEEGRIFLGKEGLRKTYRDGTMGPGQYSGAERDGESMTDDDSNIRLKILGGKKGLRPVHSQDSMTGKANTDDRAGGAVEWCSVDGRDEGMSDAVDVDMDDAEGMDSWHDKNDKVGDNSSRAGFGGIKRLGATDGSSVLDGLDPDSSRVGDKHSLYGKDDMLGRTRSGKNAAGTETAGGIRSPYSKDGLPTVAGVNGVDIKREGEVGAPYGKDGLTVDAGGHVGQAGRSGLLYGPDGLPAGDGARSGAGDGSAGEMGVLYGPDGLPLGADVDNATAGKMGGFYGKHGQSGEPGAGAGNWGRADGAGRQMGSPYQKDGLPDGAGAGGAGVGGFGGVGSPYGKDSHLAGAGVGAAGAGGISSPYGKDGLPVEMGPGASGTGVDGFGGVGSPYGKDGLPAGVGIGGAGGTGSPYGKDGLPVGMGTGAGDGGAGVGGLGGAGSPYGKDGLPAGAGVGGSGLAGAGGVGSPYGKDGLPAGAGVGGAGVGGFGGAGSPYGKDGLPAGAGTGVGGAGAGGLGGVGSPYGKDGLPAGAGAGAGGAGAGGLGGVGSPYGKDGLPVGMGTGAGVGGAGGGGFGGAGSPYGKDGLPAGAGVGGSGLAGQDAGLSSVQGYGGGAGGAGLSSEGRGVGGSAIQGAGSAYGKDGGSAGARAGAGGVGRLGGAGRDLHSAWGTEGMAGAVGMGGEYGPDSRPGKSARGEAGKRTAADFRGPGHRGSSQDKESGQRDSRGEDRDLGQLGSRYGTDLAVGGAGGKSHNRMGDGRKPGVFGQGSPGYDQTSDLYGGPSSINQRKQLPSLDIKTNDFLKNTESTEKRRHYRLDDLRAPRCHVNKQLIDVRVQKGEPAELSCAVNKEDVTGTWFKDGLKLTSMDGVLFEKQGLVHKLIFSKVEDIHAGKYRFEAGDIKTEASIFVEDPPQVDKVLLKNLTSVPTVAKAGEKIQIKIPFEGRLPVRATWLKDKMELADDSRIRVDKTDTYTMLSISNTERKDRGDYKVRLKNDSGILDIDLKVEVTDKPQPPAGPMKIVESSANEITIQWKSPKDDGGKPVQSYIVERQEVGKSDWVALGETPRSCTTFTTNKVERDMSYYFRVRAVNAEGTSDALESEEVKAASKATPGAPDPPEIISVSKDTITISWKTPRRTGSSRIVGYIVQKRKKGTMTWVPVNSVPIADKKLKMTDLKKGLQYEFCVAAVNASGVGDISAPSQPVFARDSTKPPGQVRDLAVTSSDSTSVTLTWKRPEAKDGNDVKGYDVEIRSSNNLDWTKCNVLPIETTTYTVKGLQNRELYFLRVRALNDCGPGEAAELEAFIEADSSVVSPRFLIDDTVKNFLIIKAGNTIRVDIPFEASPDPEVTWLKDGLLLSNRATISTKDGTSQLLIKAAELTDSGTYTIELKNGSGKRETFSFQVQVTDIPQNPGPILLQENVPNAVTVIWEPSASEKWERNLYYTVLKRESQKGVWHVVGDLIYTNKFTYTTVIPGRDYYFRVVAKNELGSSGPSETVQPWRIKKTKAEVHVRPQKYRGVNQNQPPRFLVPLKPHVVTTGSECRMSCAVAGHPPPKITWYKDSRDLSSDPAYFGTNDFGVCSLVIQGVSKADEGEYMVEAANELGRVYSRAFLAIKDSSL
ncbi:immunoglobulin-like and fibronectin type III domain-containing protein 1 isoform X48 [Oxyura jamaicensis]|uniref:immunoglobulin-like and fibronectin type III domain-containing protein 1 isoform X48 n=1 Tax=Oxyura jamaicensis TaxID=8884 RepID=UPI0015A67E45|nr:immunoglobulin-like and fibronectin type III domain-containing protein 1 isoform X48 [Oxyura jamaicensis]